MYKRNYFLLKILYLLYYFYIHHIHKQEHFSLKEYHNMKQKNFHLLLKIFYQMMYQFNLLLLYHHIKFLLLLIHLMLPKIKRYDHKMMLPKSHYYQT